MMDSLKPYKGVQTTNIYYVDENNILRYRTNVFGGECIMIKENDKTLKLSREGEGYIISEFGNPKLSFEVSPIEYGSIPLFCIQSILKDINLDYMLDNL